MRPAGHSRFIQERRREGSGAFEAAMDSIKLRYRPILMTAFGTIAGLLLGTVLSLFYLPMFYVWVSGKRR